MTMTLRREEYYSVKRPSKIHDSNHGTGMSKVKTPSHMRESDRKKRSFQSKAGYHVDEP